MKKSAHPNFPNFSGVLCLEDTQNESYMQVKHYISLLEFMSNFNTRLGEAAKLSSEIWHY